MSYAHQDESRVRELVAYLKVRGIEVWWDDLLEPGVHWHDMLLEKIRYASCFVVVWSEASVRAEFVQVEVEVAEQALDKGRMVPVLLDGSALPAVPEPFRRLQHVDLTRAGAPRRREMATLRTRVDQLVRRPPRSEDAGPGLPDDYAVRYATHASERIRELTARVGSIGQVLVTDDAAVDKVLAILGEVDLTLDVVSAAVQDFLDAGLGQDPRDPPDRGAFLRLERGGLERRIREGRGHCDLIAVRYGSPDGLRAMLEANAPGTVVDQADDVFGQLATADGDVFRELADIGRTLTNESRVVVNLLLAGQEEAARKRVLDGRERLLPLEDALRESTRVLQEVESSLGYAPSH